MYHQEISLLTMYFLHYQFVVYPGDLLIHDTYNTLIIQQNYFFEKNVWKRKSLRYITLHLNLEFHYFQFYA